MLWKRSLFVVAVAGCLLAADDAAWRTKKIQEWSPEDAQRVLTDSPWVKTVTPTVNRAANSRSGSRGGRRGGIGFPGGGMGRRGGMGGGGYPPGGQSRGADSSGRAGSTSPPSLKLRWESALPMREAELKARDTNAPTLDENHYAIAVYGVPNRMGSANAKSFSDRLRKEASLKREGKKDMKPSSVEVLQREDGPVVVYLFPRSKEITAKDKRLEFDAHIGRLEFTESFYTEDMVFQGKLDL